MSLEVQDYGLGLSPSPYSIEYWTNWTKSPDSLNSPFGQVGLIGLRKELLSHYKNKQNFKVSVGKSSWLDYHTFDEKYNLREILDDEIVIEFDMPKDFKGGIDAFRRLSWDATMETCINLYHAGLSFEVYDHEGKSPHVHIHDLPIKHLDKDKRASLKKIFIKRYVPLEFHEYVDLSLTGVHLIALEYALHWKGCYSYKVLVQKFSPSKDSEAHV